MGFKRENGRVLILSIMLTVSAVGMGWALTSSRFHLSIILLTLVLILLFLLFRRLTKTSREILFFFKALENDDSSISYSANEKRACEDSGLLELKLFNLVAREIGDMILLRGIIVSGKDICDVVQNHSGAFGNQDSKIYLNHKKTDLGNLLSSDIENREILLKLRFN